MSEVAGTKIDEAFIGGHGRGEPGRRGDLQVPELRPDGAARLEQQPTSTRRTRCRATGKTPSAPTPATTSALPGG